MSLLVLCDGCAFISIQLKTPMRPLEETTMQGEGRNKILIMDISGTITSEKRDSLLGFNGEPESLLARIRETLEKAAEDDRVKGIILRINSPGGAVTPSDIIYKEILNFKKDNNVYVAACLMDMATSGAYYIANAADTIIAHPTTVTGSIGVIAVKFNFKGLMDKLGIHEESIMSGEKKDIFSYWRGITDEERKIVQSVIDALHAQFIAAVDAGRKKLNAEDIRPLADGRIYTAQQALDYQLIDGIGYLDDVIKKAKTQTGLIEARVVMYHRPQEYNNNIYSQANISIFGLGEKGPLGYSPIKFMYLWNP